MSLGGDGQIVYVYNHSSVPIVVTGLHLIECENIKNSCDVQRLRIRVPAGQRMNLATVHPDNPNRAYSFRFNYSWEAARDQ
jgi:LEA14-like dessication related protein